MSELSEKEFLLLNIYFNNYKFDAVSISDIVEVMRRGDYYGSEDIVRSLIDKKVLSLSPDGYKVKFTDYGIELFRLMVKAQAEWLKQKVIKVSNIQHDQILIRSGETFKANRVIREILSQAERELCILDPYIGPDLFDLLEDSNNQAKVRIITSDKVPQIAILAYEAYKKQYARVEMRKTAYTNIKFHDRFVLWDNSRGFHIGHSLKNLGEKDTQLNLIENPREQMALFEERWAEATSV